MKQLQKVRFVCHLLKVIQSDKSVLSELEPNASLSVFGMLNVKLHTEISVRKIDIKSG